MPLIAYQDTHLRQATLARIVQVNAICAEYAAQGFQLTLRQLFYQCVSRDIIPNTVQEYKRLGTVVNTGRLEGLIDWDHIEDRTRNLHKTPSWSSPASIIEVVADQYAIDLWADQEVRPEVFVEKEALAGVFERVCDANRVPFFACRGYPSQSETWAAGQRMRGYIREGKRPVILHFGDHDPSGIDMTRDIVDRLRLFTGRVVEVERLALNMDQIQRYNPPPNPAREEDSRFLSYQVTYGDSSWELDALDPATLSALVENAIVGLRDEAAWERSRTREEQEKEQLQQVSDRWDETITWIEETA